jgi:hypothetical protein
MQGWAVLQMRSIGRVIGIEMRSVMIILAARIGVGVRGLWFCLS